MVSESTATEELGPHGERERYRAADGELRRALAERRIRGAEAVRARSLAVDTLVRSLWQRAIGEDGRLGKGIALIAVGGYGREELFPASDVDLLMLLGAEVQERIVKEPIRLLSQQMWDAGTRFAPTTRRLAECERMEESNIEFGLSLLDARAVGGDLELADRFADKVLPKMLAKSRKPLVKGLLELTRERHAKYGDTLFHLEPNVKESPGGLRDAHVCRWLARLGPAEPEANGGEARYAQGEWREAIGFLTDVRCFLHLRHERDDNTLDWRAQDQAAQRRVGMDGGDGGDSSRVPDAAYWMRIYFRNARAIDAGVKLALAQTTEGEVGRRGFPRLGGARPGINLPAGYLLKEGRVVLAGGESGPLPRADPEVVLSLFAEIAATGVLPDASVESDLVSVLPLLASRLEDGAGLWHQMRRILLGAHAGAALRVMHAVGLLDLLIPEFHGIDSLVIRDAYHRYTVDEHTFVLIDTLHGLPGAGPRPGAAWGERFFGVLAELPHPELLYLAALMHDTGKSRSTGDHTVESARLTESVLARLELEPYESKQVIDLVKNHLEMSSALRRDIFDAETIRTFAGKVQTQEALRMLLLFTYADLNAVHPDALTSWKAENLWRLYITTSNYLDHSLDEERVGASATELVARLAANAPGRAGAIAAYVEGFPERYVRTRSAEQIRSHFEMACNFALDPVQIDFRYAAPASELVLVTIDRASLFATVAGALAAWGMNILTADAFSNRQGVVVDSFRFTDTFRTLELNESERERFARSVHDVVSGKTPIERLLEGRRKASRRKLKASQPPRFLFHEDASSHSTLLEVITDDTPGLLRALSLTFAAQGCNVEVALVDTEGDTAIDVFYLTREGRKLLPEEQTGLIVALEGAVAENAS